MCVCVLSGVADMLGLIESICTLLSAAASERSAVGQQDRWSGDGVCLKRGGGGGGGGREG